MIQEQANRDQQIGRYLSNLTFGYKFFFIITIVFNAIGLLYPSIILNTVNIPLLTIYDRQLWRVLIPFLPAGLQYTAFINILINFVFNLSSWPAIERKMSTSFMIIEVFIQNFMIQTSFIFLSWTIMQTHLVQYLSVTPYFIVSLGWFPLVMIFLFQRVSYNPNEMTRFCFMPCLIKTKYVPLLFLILSYLLTPEQFLPLLIASCLGYLQYMFFKRRFIKLPLSLYRKLDAILPRALTKRSDFIKVSQSQTNLRKQCCSFSSRQRQNNNNPFNRNNFQEQNNQQLHRPSKVQIMGKGVVIGKSDINNYKEWKGNQSNKSTNSQFEIQPKLQQKIYPIYPNFVQNDSNINLVKQNEDEDENEDEQLPKQPKKTQTYGKKNRFG